MGESFVADDIAEFVLRAALEERGAGLPQLRRGHTYMRLAVIRSAAGKAERAHGTRLTLARLMLQSRVDSPAK